jgi:predicted outer membrane repeat protein
VSEDAGLRTVDDPMVSPEHPDLLWINAFRRVSISDLRLSTFGWGIRNGGDVTVESCTLEGGRRSGIVNEVGARITVRRSRISGFSSMLSYGIINEGELRLVDSTISDISGSGAILNTSVATVSGSVIENSSEVFVDGGGIDNTGTLTIESSVVRNNDAVVRGGGIYNTGKLTLIDGEVTGNSASDGGGIYNTGDISIAGTAISGNTPNDCVGC